MNAKELERMHMVDFEIGHLARMVFDDPSIRSDLAKQEAGLRTELSTLTNDGTLDRPGIEELYSEAILDLHFIRQHSEATSLRLGHYIRKKAAVASVA